MSPMGRLLIVVGVVLIILGIILSHSNFFSFLKLGRLPGDITINRHGARFYFPFTTCILLSLVLTLVLYFFKR